MSEFKWTEALIEEFLMAMEKKSWVHSISELKKEIAAFKASTHPTRSAWGVEEEERYQSWRQKQLFTYASADTSVEQYLKPKQSKQEWEILARIFPDYSPPRHPIIIREDSKYWQESINESWPIHSVRRLSDGEVFTVGDEVIPRMDCGGRPDGAFIISEFKITNNRDIRVCSFKDWLGCSIKNMRKLGYKPIPVLLTPSEIEKLKHLLNS